MTPWLLYGAYGYTGELGQWWSDRVAERAPQPVVVEWLGGHFEFVELAVDPRWQGRGLGCALHDALLLDLPHSRALLTTYRDDRPAPRLVVRTGLRGPIWTRFWRVWPGGVREQPPIG